MVLKLKKKKSWKSKRCFKEETSEEEEGLYLSGRQSSVLQASADWNRAEGVRERLPALTNPQEVWSGGRPGLLRRCFTHLWRNRRPQSRTSEPSRVKCEDLAGSHEPAGSGSLLSHTKWFKSCLDQNRDRLSRKYPFMTDRDIWSLISQENPCCTLLQLKVVSSKKKLKSIFYKKLGQTCCTNMKTKIILIAQI